MGIEIVDMLWTSSLVIEMRKILFISKKRGTIAKLNVYEPHLQESVIKLYLLIHMERWYSRIYGAFGLNPVHLSSFLSPRKLGNHLKILLVLNDAFFPLRFGILKGLTYPRTWQITCCPPTPATKELTDSRWRNVTFFLLWFISF